MYNSDWLPSRKPSIHSALDFGPLSAVYSLDSFYSIPIEAGPQVRTAYQAMSRSHRRAFRLKRNHPQLCPCPICHKKQCPNGCMLSLPPQLGEVVWYNQNPHRQFMGPSSGPLTDHMVVIVSKALTNAARSPDDQSSIEYLACTVCILRQYSEAPELD